MGLQKVFTSISGKRWYVYFYVDEGGIRKRKKLYGYVNLKKHRKNRKKRLEMLETLRKEVTRELNQGRVITDTRPQAFEIFSKTSLEKFIHKYIKDKKLYQKKRSQDSTKYILGRFLTFLGENNLLDLPPALFSKTHLMEYRNYILRTPINSKKERCSNRTANDHIIEVKAFFNYLIDNYDNVIEKNPCRGLKKLPIHSESHKAYTIQQLKDLQEWMERNDKELLFFCQFIFYSYMRPAEIRQVKVKYFDLDGERLIMPAGTMKTNEVVKPIMKVFFPILKKRLQGIDPEYYIFTKRGEPGPKKLGVNNMARRFKKVKKALNLGKEYTMYGFKHTSVSMQIKHGAPVTDIMGHTNHLNMTSFDQYAKSINAEKPNDISGFFPFLL